MFSFSSKFSKIWSSFESATDEPVGPDHAQDASGGRGVSTGTGSPIRRDSSEGHTLRSVASVFRQISSPRSTPSSPSFSSNSREHELLAQHHSLPTTQRTNPLLHRSIHRTRPPPVNSMFSDPLSSGHHQVTTSISSSQSLCSSGGGNTARPIHPIAFHHMPVQGGVDPYLVDPIYSITPSVSTTDLLSPVPTTMRKVQMRKRSQEVPSGGFTVCGRPEKPSTGTIHAPRIDKSSPAQKCGRNSGDPNTPGHEAFELICSSENLTLNMPPRNEAMSGQRRHTWVDPMAGLTPYLLRPPIVAVMMTLLNLAISWPHH